MDSTLIRAGLFLLILSVALHASRIRKLPSFGVIPIVGKQRNASEQIVRMIQAAERQRLIETLVITIMGMAAILLCPWLGPF